MIVKMHSPVCAASEFVKGIITGAVGLALVEAAVIFLLLKFADRVRITG